jgi:hypothetical protein
MRRGLICVAGIDPSMGAHVRPVLDGQLPVALLQRNGGPFDNEHDHWAVDATAIQDVQRRIRAGVPVILSVGLARAYQVTNDTEERHWLQVNGVHLGDDPVWQYT